MEIMELLLLTELLLVRFGKETEAIVLMKVYR